VKTVAELEAEIAAKQEEHRSLKAILDYFLHRGLERHLSQRKHLAAMWDQHPDIMEVLSFQSETRLRNIASTVLCGFNRAETTADVQSSIPRLNLQTEKSPRTAIGYTIP
jgi:hypothetical protein